MNLQTIKSLGGQDEYVLLPIAAYEALKTQIDVVLEKKDYIPFRLDDYIDNPIAKMRIEACLTQEALAQLLDVSQAYISKIESQKKNSSKLLLKVQTVIAKQ